MIKAATIWLLFIFLSVNLSAQKKRTVAARGRADYRTVQAALDAVPDGNSEWITIRIKPGVYTEKLQLDSAKSFVILQGKKAKKTILRWNDHTGKVSPQGDTINTYTSETFRIAASHFKAIHISFENNAGFTAGQAVAVQAAGDEQSFFHCRFLGNQDVLFTPRPGTRQYFEDCYIEGTTDFIFGASTAWFEKCQIHSKKNSHVTAASTPADQAFGYVFNQCVLTGDTSLHNVSLGRPWRPYASVVYMNCRISTHIKPEGWSNWNNTENYKTTRYAEYKNSGPGADISHRVSWSKQLSDAEAEKYTLKNVLRDWSPDPAH